MLRKDGGSRHIGGDPPLFWTENYWNLATGQGPTTTDFTGDQDGGIFFQRLEGLIRVPGAATFGGWWPADEKRRQADYYLHAYVRFFDFCKADVFEIRLPPEYFRPDIFLPQAEALRMIGAKETLDTVQIFPISSGLGSDVVSSLPKGQRWWIRKFHKEGGEVRPALPQEFERAYEIVRLNKKRRGAGISISLDMFLSLVQKNPQTYRCWVATLGNELLGSALTVDIDRQVTYVFYWADTPEGRKKSVVAAIFAAVLDDSRLRGKTMVDLGLSSVGGVIDDGLFSFKKHLGAQSTPQNSFLVDRT